MGCDIHAHIEVEEVYQGGKSYTWHFAKVWLGRNYTLFGHMAGVRSGADPVVEPRGIPANASYETAGSYKEWGADAHTPTWLDVEELKEVRDRLNKDFDGEGSYYLLDAVIAAMEALRDKHLKPRLVFWFDN